MNHADRQRLSNILRTLANEIDHSNPDIYKPDHTEMTRLINEARAIVDAPAPPQRTIPGFNPTLHSGTRYADAYRATLKRLNPPPDATIIVDVDNEMMSWTKTPAREINLDHLNSIWATRNRAARNRRRAWAATLTTTAATLTLVALASAHTNPPPSPSHQPAPQNPAATPSPAAQTMYQPDHQPGTPGNGLGVLP